jgi:hypothetical protein
VTWNTIEDNGGQPRFFGTLFIQSSAGDAIFLSTYPAGAQTNIDFLMNALVGAATLGDLAFTRDFATASILCGEVSPINAVPLPIVGIGALPFLRVA